MKSKTAKRILEETPQEVKDRVRTLTNREIELYKLGFKKNEHQQCFSLYKYDNTWTIDFWDLENFTQDEWEGDMEFIKYSIKCVKRGHVNYLKSSEGYNFAVKEKNKQIKDKINALKSKLAEEKRQKLTKTINQERVKELEAQIKILQELL